MLIPLLVLLTLVVVPAASAGDYALQVDGDRIEQRYDPHLEPDPGPLPSAGRVARVAGGPSVREALRAALDKGAISKRRYQRYSEILNGARAVFSRRDVRKKCRSQIGRVMGLLAGIASRGSLSASRMPALFLQLERNTRFWSKNPEVRLGQRVSFGKDPLVLQHYHGLGIQIQPLGSAGKANGLWKQCRAEPRKCQAETLYAMLESLTRIASWRAGGKAWEYWFPFGGGIAPWASGMAQATAMQALARGAIFFAEPRFMIAAEKALPLFLKRPYAGVKVRSSRKRGSHYLLYSFDPRLRVLNAFLQAITGLHDYAKLNNDRRARELFRQGDRAARREVPAFDTGRWSYYALPNKNLASMDYHVLVTEFLANLCERTGARVYCRTARRFARYTKRAGGPPPPGPPPAPGPRCGYL